MDKHVVIRLHSSFEDMVQKFPNTDIEFWFARDLQMLLGYVRWENFAKVIGKAMTACQNAGHDLKDHFRGITKMVDLGSGAKRAIEDIGLTRYACYLIAQNGDPAKDPIAFAQTYFAVQTRRQEVIEARLAEAERISARKKLTLSERELSGIIFDRTAKSRTAQESMKSEFSLSSLIILTSDFPAKTALQRRIGGESGSGVSSPKRVANPFFQGPAFTLDGDVGCAPASPLTQGESVGSVPPGLSKARVS